MNGATRGTSHKEGLRRGRLSQPARGTALADRNPVAIWQSRRILSGITLSGQPENVAAVEVGQRSALAEGSGLRRDQRGVRPP
jgi:hypothetical protein